METHYAVVSVTMATVYVAEKKYMLMDEGNRSSFSVNGQR